MLDALDFFSSFVRLLFSCMAGTVFLPFLVNCFLSFFVSFVRDEEKERMTFTRVF